MKILSLSIALLFGMAALARDPNLAGAPYLNPGLTIEERIEDLIGRMTLNEKIAILSTTRGVSAYEIVDGDVQPSKYLVDPGEFRIWITDCFSEDLGGRVKGVTYTRKGK